MELKDRRIRGEPHVLRSGPRTKPVSLVDLDRWPAHVGLVRHGGGRKPFFDDDLRSLQPFAPVTKQRAGSATFGELLVAGLSQTARPVGYSN
jgi:hypothetical protein